MAMTNSKNGKSVTLSPQEMAAIVSKAPSLLEGGVTQGGVEVEFVVEGGCIVPKAANPPAANPPAANPPAENPPAANPQAAEPSAPPALPSVPAASKVAAKLLRQAVTLRKASRKEGADMSALQKDATLLAASWAEESGVPMWEAHALASSAAERAANHIESHNMWGEWL